jgi:integrase
MPKKSLTEEGVRKLKAPPMRHDAKGRPLGTVDYYDTKQPGLVLRVNYGGRKTWRALYYVKGVNKKTGKARTEPRTRPIGRFPNMSVKEARAKFKKFDPQTSNRGGAETFRQVADDWISEHVEENNLRSRKEIVRQLNKYVLPEWGMRTITDIRRRDVDKLATDIKKRNGVRMATAVLGTIKSLMMWHAEREENFRVPFTSGLRKKIDPREPEERERAHYLEPDEIRALFKACDDCGSDIYGVFTKVLLLTGQRLRKVAHMQWHDVGDDGVWTVRTDKREKGHVDKVKLPQMVIDLIRSLQQVEGNPHVFPATYGNGPINAFGVFKERLDEHLPSTMRPWRFHDLRRTARTCMAEIKVPDHIAERTLGHKLQGVQRIYNRHPYFKEKSEALERLATHIDRTVNPPPPNVVTLKKRKRA